jgi:hypothetical protein
MPKGKHTCQVMPYTLLGPFFYHHYCWIVTKRSQICLRESICVKLVCLIPCRDQSFIITIFYSDQKEPDMPKGKHMCQTGYCYQLLVIATNFWLLLPTSGYFYQLLVIVITVTYCYCCRLLDLLSHHSHWGVNSFYTFGVIFLVKDNQSYWQSYHM